MASQSLFFKHSLYSSPSNTSEKVSAQMIDFKSNKRETKTIDFDHIKKRPESSLNHCDWHDQRLIDINGSLECPRCLEAIKELYS